MVYLKKLTALAGTSQPNSLKNDFSGLVWFVNNSQRKKQLELALARELAEAKTSMIPPQIVVYKTGLFYLAGELCAGNTVKDNVAEYTEDALDFLLYEILWAGVVAEGDEFGLASAYPEARNKVKNMASDLKKFMALVYHENKTAELEKAMLLPDFKDRDPYKTIFSAWQQYKTRRAAYDKARKPTDPTFFTPLEAHAALRDQLKAGKIKPAANSKTYIFEDYADMEPLFREIAELLKASGFTVEKPESAVFRNAAVKDEALDLKGFITTLDEAEYIGWNIKKQLSEKKVKEGEAAVVCFSRELLELLPFVFRRFGLLGASPVRIGATSAFKTFRAALALAFDRATSENEYLELLGSRCSAVKLKPESWKKEFSDRKSLRTLLLEAAYKAGHNENKSLNFHINAALSKAAEDLDPGEAGKINKLKMFSGAANGAPFSDLLNAALDFEAEEDEALLVALKDLAKKADEAFKACGGKADGSRELILESLLSLMAEAEYFPANEDRGENYLVPILGPDEVAASSASLLYLCGLTGEADKLRRLPIPEKLARAIGLSDANLTYQEKKRAEQNAKLTTLLKEAKDGVVSVKLSYGYINLGGDMAGQSNIVRAAKAAYGLVDTKAGAVPTLHTSLDLMFPEEAANTPDKSYALYRKELTGAPATLTGKALLPESFSEIKVVDIYRRIEKKVKKSDHPDTIRLSVGARDFAQFVNCPRKFIISAFKLASGMQAEEDLDTRLRFNKGNFWHGVYELASSKYPAKFYSAEKVQIKEALEAALEEKITVEKLDPEISQDKPLVEFKEESGRLFETFAAKEEARQKELSGLKGLGWEKYYQLKIGDFKAVIDGAEKTIEFVLSGQIDRLDYRQNGERTDVHIWDYKTGASKPLVFGGRGNVFGADAEYALQLALYGLIILEKQQAIKELKDKELTGRICGLNIFLDGSIVHRGETGYAGNMADLADMMTKLKSEYFPRFIAFMREETLSALAEDFSLETIKTADKKRKIKESSLYNPKCTWCDPQLCRLSSMEADHA